MLLLQLSEIACYIERGWLTEANHLGNVAYRCGQRLEWDADGMRALNYSGADECIKRKYRKGWSLT